jgi:DNA-binding transcriptional MocR family regulator
VDAPGLRAKWLAAAAHLHPDLNRAATAADAMVSANQAYALLRTALAQADGAAWTMQQLQRRAARHFAVPSPVSEMAA